PPRGMATPPRRLGHNHAVNEVATQCVLLSILSRKDKKTTIHPSVGKFLQHLPDPASTSAPDAPPSERIGARHDPLPPRPGAPRPAHYQSHWQRHRRASSPPLALSPAIPRHCASRRRGCRPKRHAHRLPLLGRWQPPR